MTVIEAVLAVLRDQKSPMSASEVLAQIEKRKLYSFKTKDSLNVVRAQLRRHSEGYDPPAATQIPPPAAT